MSRSYAIVRQVHNSYLVRERDRRELGWILLAATPVGITLLVQIWIHVEILGAGYKIDALEQELHRQQQVERQLRLEVSRLAQPQRVEKLAVERLGMRPPELAQMVFLDSVLVGSASSGPSSQEPAASGPASPGAAP